MTPGPISPPAREASPRNARVRALDRRRIGLSGLIVFTFGVLLGPLAHNVGHRADHVHRSHFAFALSTLRAQTDARAHEHVHSHGPGHWHVHDAPDREHASGDEPALPPGDESGDERRGPEPHHGDGSLAHFAAAVLAAALFVVPPVAAAAESVVPRAPASVFEGRERHGPIQPRAPPV